MASSIPRARYDLRSHQRFPTQFDGWVVEGGIAVAAVICDVSERSALIRSDKLPATGARVVVRAKRLDAPATVVWKTAEACGVHFDDSIQPLEVVRQNYAGLEYLRRLRVVS